MRLSIPSPDRQGRRQALVVLPYDELGMTKWNGNPFRLDDGADGKREDDGVISLLLYPGWDAITALFDE